MNDPQSLLPSKLARDLFPVQTRLNFLILGCPSLLLSQLMSETSPLPEAKTPRVSRECPAFYVGYWILVCFKDAPKNLLTFLKEPRKIAA